MEEHHKELGEVPSKASHRMAILRTKKDATSPIAYRVVAISPVKE
jgi:hypothetical protein